MAPFADVLMWQELIVAFGLVLIIEGIVPFLYPRRWQRMVEVIAEIEPRQLRIAGLVSMLIGLLIVTLVR